MKILFICDEYPPGRHGGIGTMVQMLGRELVKQGHFVFVAGLYPYSYGEKDYDEDNGVKVWRFRYGLKIKGAGNTSRIYTILEKLPDFVKARLNGRSAFNKFTRFVNHLIHEEKINIIEMPDWHTFASFIGFRIQWPHFPVPVVLKSHGSYTYFAHETKAPVDPAKYQADQSLYDHADALAAVSKYTADVNRKLFGITRNVEVLYNAIDLPENIEFAERMSGRVIFTGTLIPKKGIYQLIKAWNLVFDVLPSAELVVYGKGRTKQLKQLLTPGASVSVYFKGHVSRKTLKHELSTATAAIFPSYSECFSFAPLEAMAAGCPVIYTSRSSGPELISDYENGNLVDPDDINEMAGKIVELITNKELQQRYATNGRETVLTRFNIHDSARDHIRYYQEAINKYHTKKHE